MGGLSGVLGVFADTAFWTEAIAIAAPLLLAALGALVCGQAGIFALGIEGVFTAGAFAALLTAYFGSGPWTAVLAGTLVGALTGFSLATLTMPLDLPKRAAGLSISLLGTGLCQLCFGNIVTSDPTAAKLATFGPIDLSWISSPLSQLPVVAKLADLPYLSEVVHAMFHAAVPIYAALLIALALGYVINRTPIGLALQVCGENPAALAVQGRSVFGLRVGASTLGAALMGAGGAVLVLIGTTDAFSFAPISGRGFAALMLALIAGWRVGRTCVAVLAFAMVDAYQLHLQDRLGNPLELALLPLLPYLIALVILMATSRSTMRRFPLPPD
jgi:general nucleoside transport system permease protein